jgi:hypothetical protein
MREIMTTADKILKSKNRDGESIAMTVPKKSNINKE